jgi:hypothetical protein
MAVHNWIYQGHDINSITDMQRHCPKVWGFVYKLTLRDKKSGAVAFEYIGKKNVYTKRKRAFGKKETAALKDKRKKAYEYVIKANSTKYDIFREIIMFSTNDNDLTYQEAKHIICSDALEDPKYLNDGVSIRRFGKKIID